MQRITPSDLQLNPTATHAQGSAISTERASCPYTGCDGSGWYKYAVPAGHPLFGQLQPCQCRRDLEADRGAEQYHQRIADLVDKLHAEIGSNLLAASFQNYNLSYARDGACFDLMSRALETCRAYADDPQGWLYLYGPTGVGKSHLAAATGWAMTSAGKQVAYISELGLATLIRAGWGKRDDDSADARIETLQSVDLLILDDYGTEYRKSGGDNWIDTQILALLMPRHQNSRPTIITSNLPIDYIDEPRLRSRIRGMVSEGVANRNQYLLIDNDDQRERGAR